MKINQLNSCILKTVLKSENASLARLYSALFNIFLLSPKRIRAHSTVQTNNPSLLSLSGENRGKKKRKKKGALFFSFINNNINDYYYYFCGF